METPKPFEGSSQCGWEILSMFPDTFYHHSLAWEEYKQSQPAP